MRRSDGSSHHHVTSAESGARRITTSNGSTPLSCGAAQFDPRGKDSQWPNWSVSLDAKSYVNCPCGRLIFRRTPTPPIVPDESSAAAGAASTGTRPDGRCRPQGVRYPDRLDPGRLAKRRSGRSTRPAPPPGQRATYAHRNTHDGDTQTVRMSSTSHPSPHGAAISTACRHGTAVISSLTSARLRASPPFTERPEGTDRRDPNVPAGTSQPDDQNDCRCSHAPSVT